MLDGGAVGGTGIGRRAVGGGIAGGSAGRRRPITVGYLPKDIVNQYFAAAKTGIDKAAGETGGTVIQVGPNEAKADLQIPFITDLTTQGVDAIIISADGKDEVAPALKAAMAAGIKVVGFDSSPAVGAYDVFVNQVDFSGVGVNLADWACELAPNCTGEIAILSAAATATNQNEWIELMKTTLDRGQVQGPQARRHRLRRRRRHEEHARRPRPCSPSTRTSRSSSPRPPSASSRPPRSCQAGRQVGLGQGDRPRLPERHEAVRRRRHLPGLRPVERPGPRLPLLQGRRQARQRRDHRQRKARPSRCRASTTTSRTRSARTAS